MRAVLIWAIMGEREHAFGIGLARKNRTIPGRCRVGEGEHGMRCQRCGRETIPASLSFVGTTVDCQLCLSCNYLYVRHGLNPNPANQVEHSTKRKSAPIAGIPAAEYCELTPEEEAVARRLLGA